MVSTAPTFGRAGFGCTLTAVPQAVQKAAWSSSGISHCAQNWSSPGRPDPPARADRSNAASIEAGMQHIADPQDQDRQDDQPHRMLKITPSVALPTKENRYVPAW